MTRSLMEARLNHDFGQVRVHTDARAQESARALNAAAYTVGPDLVFGPGMYQPTTSGGRKLLVHELTHTVQQSAGQNQPSAPLKISEAGDATEQEAESAAEAGGQFYHPTLSAPLQISRQGQAAAPSRQPFSLLWSEFDQHRHSRRDAEALALAPALISAMSTEDLIARGNDLGLWLMDQGNWPLAQQVFYRARRAWFTRTNVINNSGGSVPTLASDVPPFINSPFAPTAQLNPDQPQPLIDRAMREERAGRTAQAFALFGQAYLIVQLQLQRASAERQTDIESGAQLGTTVLTGPSARAASYAATGESIALMRAILGFYPQLEREALEARDYPAATRAADLAYRLRMILRDRYTVWEGPNIITAETTAVSAGPAATTLIHGVNARDEVVTRLPGTPAQAGLSYAYSLENLQQHIAGQEEFISLLWHFPGIVNRFGGRRPPRPNMADAAERRQVWAIIFQAVQGHSDGLARLLSLMQTYLQHYTFHTDWSIRDFGVNYLTTDFPTDLAGRAARDCGVYALTVAYELFQAVRSVSPAPHVAFRLFAMFDHVILGIFSGNQHFIVNNDQITGPFPGGDPNVAFQTLEGVRIGTSAYDISPVVTQDLAATDAPVSEAQFRDQAWERYRALVNWQLQPLPPGGALQTEQQRREAAYRQYYNALENINEHAPVLAGALNDLSAGLRQTPPQFTPQQVGQRLTELTAEHWNMINDFFGCIRINLVPRNPNLPHPVLTHPQIFSEHAFDHPLTRLAEALMYYESLGGTLNPQQTTFLGAIRLIPFLRDQLDAYDGRHRPPLF